MRSLIVGVPITAVGGWFGRWRDPEPRRSCNRSKADVAGLVAEPDWYTSMPVVPAVCSPVVESVEVTVHAAGSAWPAGQSFAAQRGR